jgi:hypothetical protein
VPASRACSGHMHPACGDWVNCSCECHQVCERCGKQCRKVYQRDDESQRVCSTCHKRDLAEAPKVPGCEVCGKPVGYRDPRSGDQRFLCAGCHLDAGHGLGRQFERERLFGEPATTSAADVMTGPRTVKDEEKELDE